jgi:hypothetical protein
MAIRAGLPLVRNRALAQREQAVARFFDHDAAAETAVEMVFRDVKSVVSNLR